VGWGVECGVWGVGCGVWGVGCGVGGWGVGVCGLGFQVWVQEVAGAWLTVGVQGSGLKGRI
jgi:hypothetical protein